MRLSFVSPYLSISEFEAVDVPSLCVITGVNGAGKSHLLQAITKGHVAADAIREEEIVLFSGETFRLDNQSEMTADMAVQERYTAWSFLTQQQNPNLSAAFTDMYNSLGDSAQRIKDISKTANKPIWYLSERDGLTEHDSNLLEEYKRRLQTFMFNPQVRGNHQAQSILSLCKKITEFINEMTKERFYALYEPQQFRENFLPAQLTLAFADYYSRMDENEYYEFRNSRGESHSVLSEEEFIKRHGPKPWDVINQVLSQIGSVPYRINSPEGLTRYDRFQAELIHQYTEGVRPNFSDLSSGEKILIALVVSVYKASSDRNFPKLLLLDEIDASLHPSMMQSMLQIIEDVFVTNGVSTILITHSPTTVAICPEESLYVMHSRGLRRIEHRAREDALDILTEGFVTLTKGLTILDEVARTRVSIVTEGHNVDLIRRAFDLSGINDVEIVSGVEDRSGSQQLKTLYDFFVRMRHTNKIVIAWDCDAQKFRNLTAANNTHPFVFERNSANGLALSGIENLFPEELLENFKKQITFADGRTKAEFDNNQKKEFSQFILDRRVAADFERFSPFVEFVRRLQSETQGPNLMEEVVTN